MTVHLGAPMAWWAYPRGQALAQREQQMTTNIAESAPERPHGIVSREAAPTGTSIAIERTQDLCESASRGVGPPTVDPGQQRDRKTQEIVFGENASIRTRPRRYLSAGRSE